jgi:hypothetical protein
MTRRERRLQHQGLVWSERLAQAGREPSEAESLSLAGPVASSGAALDAETRAFMEPRFGHHFGQVRIHAGEGDTSPAVVGPAGGPLSPDLEARLLSERGRGASLNGPIRKQMEQAFGTDFADVRLHTDAAAQALNRSLGASAFTMGSDIFLAPESGLDEKQLLAHELTHVVQQRGGESGGPLVVGPISDGYEQEAESTSAAIASRVAPPIRRASDHVTAAVAEAGAGMLIQRRPSSRQRLSNVEKREEAMEQRMEAMEQRMEAMEKREKARDIHMKAMELDQQWMPRFEQLFSEYHEAINRIATGMQAASKGFREAQSKQAEFETAVWGAVKAMVTVAGGFEFAFAPALGKLGGVSEKTAEEIGRFGGHIFSVAHAGAGVTLDYIKEHTKPGKAPESESIPGAQIPAGAGGGDPLAFLTSNQAALEHHWQQIVQAFAVRSALTRGFSDEEWLNFDVGAQEKIYQQLYADFQTVASPASKLADDAIIALVLERHMWASWIQAAAREAVNLLTLARWYGIDLPEDEETPHSMFTPGAEIERRLKELNIDILAQVELTGHWYSSNSPNNWRDLLIKWAHEYDQGIAK